MRLPCLTAMAVLLSGSPGLHATPTPLAPGASVMPGSGSYSPAGTPNSINFTTSAIYVTESVFADGTNPLCPNCLDFVISVSNNKDVSTGISVISVSTEDYAGFKTDIAYYDAGGTMLSPFLASRSEDGTEITFNLTAPPGTSSDPLIIYTNATSYGPGNIDIGTSLQRIDPPAFAPTAAATPEPSCFVLLGTGLLFVAGAWKRHIAWRTGEGPGPAFRRI